MSNEVICPKRDICTKECCHKKPHKHLGRTCDWIPESLTCKKCVPVNALEDYLLLGATNE
jgi:hypothetical protein